MFPVSDKIKKWSILIPTYPLPAKWRVAVRRACLAQLALAKAERASLIIIGHPKSGNTWLKVMLSRLYQVRYNLPASRLMNTDELALKHPAIPRIVNTNGYFSYEDVVGKALAPGSLDSPLKRKPVILIARHPCDIAVSWYFQFTRRQSAVKQELINYFIDNPIDRRAVEMWEFVRHSDIGLPAIVEFLNLWERSIDHLENGHIIRYEDLRAEPARVLKQVTGIIGEHFSADEIAGAVAWGSFDNLRKLETSGFFKQGGMRLRDRNDETTLKVRRGKVGGFHDYFTPEQAAELEEIVAKRLSPRFGYCPAFARKQFLEPASTAVIGRAKTPTSVHGGSRHHWQAGSRAQSARISSGARTLDEQSRAADWREESSAERSAARRS